LFFQIDPVESSVYNDTIDHEIRLREGPQATIKNVNISGNDKTKEYVIRRELRTVPGEKFSRADLIRSQREIINLGYFNQEKLGMQPVPNSEDGTVDINYTVEEKSSDQLELSAGWGGNIGLTGTLGVTFNNFSIKNIFRKELEWMRKQPKARTTKSKSRQDRFYEVEAKAGQKLEDQRVQLQIKMSRLGGKVVEMKKVYKSYGPKQLVKGFDYTFSKGERVGVIGKNGVGKSTFLNMLQLAEPPDSGKINVGETVVFGNFSQQGLVFKENVRVIEYVKSIAENFPLASGGSLSAAQFLELFLF
jgi:hypothetical protein